MNIPSFRRFTRLAAAAALVLAATPLLHAQQRGGGGGGGGFGGFGGFGGGGGNNANRGGSSSSSSQYNNNGSVGSAIISVDPQTHNIIVIADADTSLQISNVISNLDSPKPQVLINVVFVEVQLNNSSDIGVEGGWAKNVGNGITTGGGSVLGLSGLNSVVTNASVIGGPMSSALTPGANGAGAGGLYQIAGTDFQATLRAIAKAGKAQVLSKPSIIARDGQLAKIVVGQQVPLPSGVSFAQAGNNTIPIVNVSYTDVGIILNVTPFIGANGQVEMIVQPQISSVSPTERQSLSSDVSAPYINVRSADTVVVTPHSQTVVIGGLISDTKSDAESKVPILGSIPGLGNLFKSRQKSRSKTELLIFLTPYIVDAPTQLASLSSSMRDRSQVITNAATEKELDRFLEKLPTKKQP
jgi:general secretion pathway protein D